MEKMINSILGHVVFEVMADSQVQMTGLKIKWTEAS